MSKQPKLLGGSLHYKRKRVNKKVPHGHGNSPFFNAGDRNLCTSKISKSHLQDVSNMTQEIRSSKHTKNKQARYANKEKGQQQEGERPPRLN